jgi:hypothetical protein
MKCRAKSPPLRESSETEFFISLLSRENSAGVQIPAGCNIWLAFEIPNIRPAVGSWGISRASDRLLIGFLILCATLPYLNTLRNCFVYDDVTQAFHNPYIRTFHTLRTF